MRPAFLGKNGSHLWIIGYALPTILRMNEDRTLQGTENAIIAGAQVLLRTVRVPYTMFRKSTMSMPRAATTWGTTGLIRAVARTRVGVRKLHWIAGQLINATPPKETWPLFHDGKMKAVNRVALGWGDSY